MSSGEFLAYRAPTVSSHNIVLNKNQGLEKFPKKAA